MYNLFQNKTCEIEKCKRNIKRGDKPCPFVNCAGKEWIFAIWVVYVKDTTWLQWLNEKMGLKKARVFVRVNISL